MNITDYLAEYLRKGNEIEIPGIGVLANKEVKAFFDEATSTFHPTSSTIQLAPANGNGSEVFIKHLADKECINVDTARQIWKNYNDAIQARLDSDGKCQLTGLGTLTRENGSYSFAADTQADNSASAGQLKPISATRRLSTAAPTPFSQFQNHAESSEPFTTPLMFGNAPDPSHANSHEPMPEPEPEPMPEPEPDSMPEPEPEPMPEPEPDPMPEPEPEPMPEPEPVLEPEPELEPKPEPKPTVTQPSTLSSQKSVNETLKQLDAIDKSDGNPFGDPKSKKNKTRKKGAFLKALLWIIITLIVLLACAFAIDHYLFNSKGRNWVAQYIPALATQSDEGSSTALNAPPSSQIPEPPDNYDRDAARDNITDFTYSLEGLSFSEVDLDEQRDEIMANMSNYLNAFLKSTKQEKNVEPFMDHVSDYIDNRLADLLDDKQFHPQALFNYDDYVRQAVMPSLKARQMKRKSLVVQTELMSTETLERLLSEVVPADELTPDPAALREQEAAQQKAKAAAKTEPKPAPVRSTILTASKQGFDIIAGAYVNKSTADNLCSQLKRKGCDAYIINRNGLYYVSMGSASTRTEADARFVHIKEWYKGDISIKKW